MSGKGRATTEEHLQGGRTKDRTNNTGREDEVGGIPISTISRRKWWTSADKSVRIYF